MPAFLRRGLILLTFCALGTLGCEDDPTQAKGAGGQVRSKAQLALDGEPCDDVTEICNDNNPCTLDTCVGLGMGGSGMGTCTITDHADTEPCNIDGSLCTVGVCDGAGSCDESDVVDCADSWAGGADNPCTSNSCNPTTGACSNPATNEGGTCEEGDLCTDGVCTAGSCISTPKVCDTDPDDCLAVSCEPSLGTCTDIDFVSQNTACDDGNPCTNGTSCNAAGACTQVTSRDDCDDSNECTTDLCVDFVGCSNAAVICPNDGSVCTVESCNPATGCESAPLDCNDNNICTADSCNAITGCAHADQSATCNDNNTCTDDSCNPAAATVGTRCVNADRGDGAACNDGSACNTGETCLGAVCQGGTAVNCNDGNDCTQDSCNPATGCQNPNRPSGFACDDDIDCTTNETCNSSGACVNVTRDHNFCNTFETACAESYCTGSSGSGCELDPPSKDGFVCNPPASDCDLPEFCDGVSPSCPADVFADNMTECVAASCTGGIQTDQLLCSGSSNMCGTPNTVDCDGHACGGGSPSQCLTTCTSNSQCLPTHYCDTTTNDCAPRQNPGGPCAANDNCAQGDTCVDGRCCNAPCTGQCEACDVAGFLGECVPVPAGEAPHPGGSVGATRPACATDGSSCGGACDGTARAACSFPAAGTECEAAACNPTTNQAVEASVCNGLGACNAPAKVSCDPFTCSGDSCRVTCTQDSHCDGALQCIAGTCVDQFDNGSDCTVGTQCQSGLCVDGVCCDGTCTGQCEACNVAGNRGTCSAVTGEPEGSRPSCGGSGECASTCDGENRSACTYPSSDVTCREATCTDGNATIVAYCNGGGICPGAQTVTCDDGCDGLTCANPECSVNTDCSGDEVCRAGVCVPPDENGAPCSGASDCESGFCVDGVCCDAGCSGQCEACNVPGSEGTCSPAPANTQPRGGRQPCTSDGTICGGSCDGATRDACEYPATGECRAGSCTSGVAIVAASCDGTGTCPIQQEQDCGAVSCDAADTVCDGACATDPEACGTDQYCSAGICVDLLGAGAACAADSQCGTGFCVDGICCQTECVDQCGACNVPGSFGTCSPVTGAPVGGRPACGGSGTCAATCDGQDVRSCSFPGNDVSCSSETCESGVQTRAGTCGGDGRCVAGEAIACPTLLCNGSECATSCQEDDECPGEQICSEGACIDDPLIDAVDKGSCGCKVPGGTGPRGSHLPLLLLPLGILLVRRRKNRPCALR